MEQEVWLQYKDDCVLFDVEEGRLDVKEIAAVWDLDPSSLVIASRKVKMGDNGLSSRLVDAFRVVEEGRDGRSKEKALTARGQPSTRPPSVGVSDLGTPPVADFEKYLQSVTFPLEPSIEDVEHFLSSAPISRRIVWFVRRFLVSIPANGAYVEVLGGKGGTFFPRPDYLEFLTKWGQNGAKVLVLSGRRRSGKTIGLPYELLRARKEILKRADKVMFYLPGDEDHESIHFSTIIKLLSFMKIPALFDEFTSMSSKICRVYKAFLENWKLDIDPLSAILFGSNESMIWTEGTSSIAGCCSIGGFMRRLPAPPLSLMLSMLREREQDLTGSELGLRFLRKMTLHGCDLSSHATYSSINDASLEFLEGLGLQQITFTSGEILKALEKLVFNKGLAKGIDSSTLINLQNQEYIKRRPNSTEYYDFLDPRMLAFYGSSLNESLEHVEGKVLESLLQTERYLLSQLLKVLEVNVKIDKVKENMWHGQITGSTEMDLLLFVEDEAFLISAKRVQSKQQWGKSFLFHMDNLYLEWRNVPSKLQMNMRTSTKLHLVAVSGSDDGEIIGTCPGVYDVDTLEIKIRAAQLDKRSKGRDITCETGAIPEFVKKQIVCHTVLLHELLEKVERLPLL